MRSQRTGADLMCLGPFRSLWKVSSKKKSGIVDPSLSAISKLKNMCVSVPLVMWLFKMLLKVFMTKEVKTIGLRSFMTLGLYFLGMIRGVFPCLWDLYNCWSTPPSCSAQCLSVWLQISWLVSFSGTLPLIICDRWSFSNLA